jgi:DDE family transposase
LPVWDINTAKVLLAKIILSANYNPVLRAQENRSYLKQKGIHFAGKPLGRPKIVTEENRDELKQLKTQRRTDYLQRIPIEGKFGQGKKGYRLNYIRGKRAHTTRLPVSWYFQIAAGTSLYRFIQSNIYC